MNVVSVKQEPGVTRDAFDGSPALLNGVRSRVNRDTPPSRIDTVDASMFWAIGAPDYGSAVSQRRKPARARPDHPASAVSPRRRAAGAGTTRWKSSSRRCSTC